MQGMSSPSNKDNKIVRLSDAQVAPGETWRSGVPLTNLPVPATAFIGRAALVNEIQNLIVAEDVRVLTLTGPGGVGKTRLALRVAEQLLPEFEDGVYFVGLASVSNPDMVVSTIAQTLGVAETGATPIVSRLRDYLRDRDMLLILDNFEQVVGAARDVASILAGAIGVHVIVTTRISLHLYGEHEYLVPPMALPELEEESSADAEKLKHYETVELFVARTREIQHGFHLTTDNAGAVAAICRKLDGLPLALELAAARIRLFSPQALLTRLGHSLQFLTGGSYDLPARQQTLRDTIGWSYDLLDEVEQRLFTRLGVFAGGCTLDAAGHIAADLKLEEAELYVRLEALIDKNLLRRQEYGSGETRLWMLNTIREYALEKLAQDGEGNRVQEAHALYYLEQAEAARTGLRSSDQEVWLDALERDHDNYRAAITYLLERPDRTLAIRLVGLLGRFWYVRGYFTEANKWFEMVLPKAELSAGTYKAPDGEAELAWWAECFRGAGTFAFLLCDYSRAIIVTRQSVEMARKLTDKTILARGLNNLSTILSQQGDLKQAHPYMEESLALKRQIGERADIAVALGNLALNQERMGNYDLANSLNEEGIALDRETGNKTDLANRYHNQGVIALREGKIERAVASLSESLALARELGYKSCEVTALSDLGAALCDAKDSIKAQALLEEALRLSKELGDLSEESWAKLGMGRLALLSGDLQLAQDLMKDALRLRVQLQEYNPSAIETLEWLATVFVRMAKEGANESASRATILWGAVGARRAAMGTPLPPIWQEQHRQTVEQARVLLGSRAFTKAWDRGRAMTFVDAIGFGVHGIEALDVEAGSIARDELIAVQAQTSEEGLTSREIDVLRLIAAGLTNKEIAERLVVSHRTVEAHLYSVFNKLNVTTRSAATRYAMEHDLGVP